MVTQLKYITLILVSLFTLLSCNNSVSISNVDGMTIKGLVHNNGKGIANVVVSDGFELTTTDENGIYYLASKKEHGYVFVSIPGNYEVKCDENMPQFFQYLNGGTDCERIDFELSPTDNSNHVTIAMADWHLANKYDDLNQFENNVLPDVNNLIQEYRDNGVKVYGLTLGDMSYERYWKDTNFGLDEYLKYMNRIDCPIFNVMGNHDNNPYCEGDWQTEQAYKDVVGPTYYSYNLGDVHYIVLDNIEYINDGATPKKMGKRNYNGKIVPHQMEWLKKDLATITDKNTPIIIAMHIPLSKPVELTEKGEQVNKVFIENGEELLSLLKTFSNVDVLSGHTHINYTIEIPDGPMEHNIAALSAAWWRTGQEGYANNHICKDGSPGGYGVFEFNKTNLNWYYKSIGYNKEYQFRTYDLNASQITNQLFASASKISACTYAKDYANPKNDNEVLINVWGYDSQWNIEVKENESYLDVERVLAHDPLFIISHVSQYLDKGLKSYKKPSLSPHMFKVKASEPNSTLKIAVRDRFGNIYRQEMIRPKELNCSMQ